MPRSQYSITTHSSGCVVKPMNRQMFGWCRYDRTPISCRNAAALDSSSGFRVSCFTATLRPRKRPAHASSALNPPMYTSHTPAYDSGRTSEHDRRRAAANLVEYF